MKRELERTAFEVKKLTVINVKLTLSSFNVSFLRGLRGK